MMMTKEWCCREGERRWSLVRKIEQDVRVVVDE